MYQSNSSLQITDKSILSSYITRLDFPYLISFPRTGSHWLRMIMELYFEKPSLVRVFYFFDAGNFTCYHRHDEDLSIRHENVIYLYRNPVDTVYSQLNYYKESLDEPERILYWANLYGRHLSKWLIEENFTKKKTILTYEGMKSNLENEFKKICEHFETSLITYKLHKVAAKVTPEEVKDKTSHDLQVINRKLDYETQRVKFWNNFSELIASEIYRANSNLSSIIQITL